MSFNVLSFFQYSQQQKLKCNTRKISSRKFPNIYGSATMHCPLIIMSAQLLVCVMGQYSGCIMKLSHFVIGAGLMQACSL